MALNRYSTLPKVNIRDTQVLPDLGILDSALARKQTAYDTTAATASKFKSDVSQLQGYGDYAKNYIKAVDADVNNKIASIANKDLGSPEIRNDLNGYVQSVASNPELKKIEQANALRANYDKQQADLESKGKLHNSQKILQDLAWQKYSQTGEVSPELSQPLYEAQDLVKGRSDLVSMLKANGTDIIASLSDGTAYKNSSKGIASDRIKRAVEAQLPTYINSQYGRQEYNDWKAGQLTGAIPKTMKFGDYITNQVMSTASNFAHSDYSTNMDAALNSSRKEKQEKVKEGPATILSETEGFNLSPVPKDEKYVNGEPASKSSILPDWMGLNQLTDEEKKDPNYQARAAGAKGLGITVEEYDKRFRNQTHVPVQNLVKQTSRKDLTTLIADGNAGLINSAKILNKDGTSSTLKEVIVNSGVSNNSKAINEFIKDNIQATGRVEPSAAAADGYRISMNGNDYIMDTTPALIKKIEAKTATKDDINRYQTWEMARVKAGYPVIRESAEGKVIGVYDHTADGGKGKIVFKPYN